MLNIKKFLPPRLVSSNWDLSEVASSIVTLRNFPKDFRTRKRIKYCRKREAVREIFREYCDKSSIHGIRYLGEEKRPCWERTFWILIFSVSIFICSKLIHNIVLKWDQSPMIVSFAEKSTPVWNIPFPAVTICPETKTLSGIFNFSQTYSDLVLNKFENGTINLENIDLEQAQYMEAMLQTCSFNLGKQLKFPSDFPKFDFIEKLEKIYPDANFTYAFCMFRNEVRMCEQYNFDKVYTDEGICYTFNGLKSRDIYREKCIQFENSTSDGVLQWNLEDGYSLDAETDKSYPYRIFGAGRKPGLFMVLQGIDFEFDYLCNGLVQGFKVLLHSPDDVPLITKNYLRVPFGKEILVSVSPNVIDTSAGLRHYLPERRQCYFKGERKLYFFKIYSQSNCELECIANITLSRCGCVKFSMPRESHTPVCNHSKIECYYRAEDELLRIEYAEGIKSSTWNKRAETKCNCLPACTSLVYDAQISPAHFDFMSVLRAFDDEHITDYPGIQMSRLSIFFKETQFITSRRSELYGTTDFLANCGGLLALFMGVSALSLMELLYYCTARLFTNIKMRRESQKVISEMTKTNLLTSDDQINNSSLSVNSSMDSCSRCPYNGNTYRNPAKYGSHLSVSDGSVVSQHMHDK